MSLSLRSMAGVLLTATALAACGSSNSGSGPENIGVPGVDASLSFEHQGALTMAPGEVVEVVVKGTPPAPYAMTFFLSGKALDASLDKSKTVAGQDGVATVLLRAPNAATSFAFRATIKDGPSADLIVAVSDQGFGVLDVTPVYHGNRPIDQWRAHVLTGSCAMLKDQLPLVPAGALAGTAAPGDKLLVKDVPVGPNLAVVVVAGGFAWGCSDEAGLLAGSTTSVSVAVANKPIDVADAELDLALELVPDQPAYDNLMIAEMLAFKEAFFSAGQGPVSSLLNSMQAASNDPTAFYDASVDNDWEMLVTQHLISNSIDLDSFITTFASAGLSQQQPLLHGRLSDVADSGEYGTFEWDALGNINAAQLGSQTAYTMTLSTDPDDTVRLGVSLLLQPSRFIGAVMSEACTQQYNAVDAVAALADVAQCSNLHLEGMDGCNDACIAQLCRDALQTMWAQALEASATNYGGGTMPMQVSGAAMLDGDARLIGFEGSWLGKLKAGQNEVSVSGTASGASESPPAPAR